MRLLIAVALLCGAQACAQEAGGPLPPIPDDAYKRGGRPASQWEERATINERIRTRNVNEPPAPPLLDHPCALFDGTEELIELKLASDATPEPVGLLVPAPYLPSRSRYRATEVEGVALLSFWVHDLAPFVKARKIYSLAKTPADDITMLARRSPDGTVDFDLRKELAPTVYEREQINLTDPDHYTFIPELFLLEVHTEKGGVLNSSDVTGYTRLRPDGHASDFIYCRKARDNHRCHHRMAFGQVSLKISYDHAFLPEWARIRSEVEMFIGCARAAYAMKEA